MVDLRLGFKTDTWSIFGFGRNLLNEKQYVDFYPPAVTGSPQTFATLGQPVTYGIEARYDF